MTRRRTLARAIAVLVTVPVVLFAPVFVWATLAVRAGRAASSWPSADVAIVLGAAVADDGGPGPALTRRARRGMEVLRAHRVAALVTTGGVGRHGRAEGDVAREWILARDASLAPLLHVERTSTTTHENLEHALPILRTLGARRVWLVSDGYHLARATRMARDLGIDAQGVPADADDANATYAGPQHLAREAALLSLYVVTRRMIR